jgi:transcription initiation factor TFIIB
MVLGERIVDDTPEWRVFANDDRGGDVASKSRVGDAADYRYGDQSLTTFLVNPKKNKTSISTADVAAVDGGSFQGKRPSLASNTESSQVRRMGKSMERIQELADSLALPKQIVQIAFDLYGQAEKKGLSMRGPEKESVVVAILFVACRKSGNARSLKEFEAASGITKKRIGKSFMNLTKNLEIEMSQPTTEEYVSRFCSRLGLPNKTQMIASDVAKKANTLGLSSGKSPIAVAASVIYLVAAYTNSKRSIQEISDVSMIGEKNVKVVCKELHKSRLDLFEGVILS